MDEYFFLAAKVTNTDADALRKSSKIDLLDSALHAPQTNLYGQDQYKDIFDKASVLCERLVKNHPLLDGNKRSAWYALRLFLRLNGVRLNFNLFEAEFQIEGLASGQVTREDFKEWLKSQE